MKKLITIISFQIGVNVIGLPEFFQLKFKNYATRSTLAYQ
jgi:hypothetical protein